MAQAQYDKFIELRKSGVDALTARKQAYGDIPTAPTPTTPTPTGGATLPIAPQVQQPTTPTTQPIANRGDVVVGVNGEKFVQANNYDGSYGTAGAGTGQVVNQSGQAMSQMEQIQAEAFGRREGANIGQIPNKPMTEQEKNAKLGGFIQDNGINSFQPLNAPTSMPAGTNEPVKAKEVPTIDFNVSQGREGDIQKNVSDITATNPTLLKDRNAFNQAFGYETADQGKKALLDSAFQSSQPQTPNADQMFSSIMMKAPVSDEQKVTTQYKVAQNRYLKASSYASMTPSQVSTDISSGKLIEGSQTYEDIKSMNPKLIQDTNNLRIVNGSKVNLYSTDSQGNKVNNVEQSFTEDYLGDFGTFLKGLFKVQTLDEINAVIRTDEVKSAEAKADEYELELNKIEEGGLEIEKRVRKELEGTGASAERIRLEVAIAQEENDKKYNSVLKKYTQFANKANNLITQNTTVYQESMKQKSAQQQAIAGAAGQVFSQGLAQENERYKANLGLQAKQAEFEQGLAQQAQLAKDPVSAVKATLKTFSDLGILADRSEAEIIADVQAKVASGIPLGQAISELQTAFKSKPQYQKALELNMGQLSDADKLKMGYQFDISKMGLANQYSTASDIRNFEQQKEIAKLNNDYNRQDFLFQIENDPVKRAAALELEQKLNANKSLFDVLGKNAGTYEGNRGYDLAGKLGDPLPAGGNWTVKSVGTAGEQVGSIFVGGKGSKPWGNTVVMTDENGNEIRYSHLQDIGVKEGDILGFGDIVGTRGNTGNVKGGNGETLTAEQLKAGRGSHLDVEIKDSSGRLLSQNEQIDWLKSKKANTDTGITEKQFTQFNQMYSKFNSDPNVKAFESALAGGGDLIASLNSANGPGDVGAVFGFMKSLDPASVVKEGEFALAAKSAGVWESFKNIPANKLDGTILTDKQRKDFGKLAFEYIKSKGKLYDVKYGDLTKVLEQQKIPKSYYPTKMTDLMGMYGTAGDTGSTKTENTPITGTNNKDYSSYFVKPQ